MHRLSLFFLVLISFTLSGCSLLETAEDKIYDLTGLALDKDNTEPPTPLKKIRSEVEVSVLWKKKVGDGYDGQSLRLTPAVFENRVVAAEHGGLIVAYDALTGDQLWKIDTEQSISAGPTIHYDTVLVGTSDARVLAFNLADGSERWSVPASSEVLASPRSEDGVVVIRTIDGRIIGLNERTGHQIWSYERDVPPLSLRGAGAPAIFNQQVIVGYASGKLVALRLNSGKVEWETTLAVPQGRSELDRLVDLDTDPVILDDVIYISGFQAGVFAASMLQGEQLWARKDISTHSGLANDWSYLYLSDEASDLWSLDQQSGRSMWKQKELHRRRLGAPTIFKDYLVVGDFEGYLHWLSRDDGRLLGRIQIGSDPIEAAPVVDDEVLYVYGKGGVLVALTVKARALIAESTDDESSEESSENDFELPDESEGSLKFDSDELLRELSE